MIEPAVATTAHLLPQLWITAVSAGDVDAAWSLYAADAVLVPWHLPAVRGAELRAALAWLAELRLPVYLRDVRASAIGSEALLHAQWSISGADAAGSHVALAAETVVLARQEISAGRPPHWETYLERWAEPSTGPLGERITGREPTLGHRRVTGGLGSS